MDNKNMKIENIRALAIFLVVLGHSIIMYTKKLNFIETQYTICYVEYIRNIINVLEMPLFMSVSGFVFWYSMKKRADFWGFLKNKFLRILLPYFFVGCLWLLPTRMLSGVKSFGNSFQWNVVHKIFLMEDSGHLWYLPCLFAIFVVMYVLHKVLGNLWGDKSFDFGVLFLLFFISIIAKEEMGDFNKVFQRFFMYLFWFDLGFIINKYDLFKFQKSNSKCYIQTIWYLVIFAVFMCTYFKWKSNYIYYAAALFGVLGIYAVMPKESNRFVSFISKNSYGLYLFHSPMVWIVARYMPDINAYIVVLFNVIVLGGIAIGITCLLRKTKLRFIIGE